MRSEGILAVIPGLLQQRKPWKKRSDVDRRRRRDMCICAAVKKTRSLFLNKNNPTLSLRPGAGNEAVDSRVEHLVYLKFHLFVFPRSPSDSLLLQSLKNNMQETRPTALSGTTQMVAAAERYLERAIY